MNEAPRIVGSLEGLQSMIRGRILERTGGRIRGLRVESLKDRIVVSGSAPTHQLHELVMAAIRESVCDSLIKGDRAVPVCMHVLMSAGTGPLLNGGSVPGEKDRTSSRAEVLARFVGG